MRIRWKWLGRRCSGSFLTIVGHFGLFCAALRFVIFPVEMARNAIEMAYEGKYTGALPVNWQ